MAGIGLNDNVVQSYNALKQRKHARFLTYKIENNQVTLDREAPRTATYDEFVASLSGTQPLYAVFDLDYEHEGIQRNKMLFFAWVPDTAPVRAKLPYAATKEAVKNALGGGLIDFQASDMSQVAADAVLQRVRSQTRG